MRRALMRDDLPTLGIPPIMTQLPTVLKLEGASWVMRSLSRLTLVEAVAVSASA